MKCGFAVMLVGLSVAPALAHPSKMDGRWTTKKGNCHQEYRVSIGPKSFEKYEYICKILKETAVNPLNIGKEFDDYKLDILCDSEGEEVKEQIFINGIETNDQLKVSFGSDKPDTHRWLYRCKK